MNGSGAVSVESKRLTLFNKEQVSLVVGRIADEVCYRSYSGHSIVASSLEILKLGLSLQPLTAVQ
jgi:hypothetical protein